jgi:aspartyl-tRNA(Asn)/glutamyl-tRNA(Gln) amidotransferase subunit C
MDIKDVENLAELARIDLSSEEKKTLLKDMEDILEYVKQIESVDIGDVNTEYALYNVWREDTLEAREFSRELILKQFPDSQPARPDGRSGGDGIFLKVKKIL